MRKIALFCAICLFIAAIPFQVAANSDITVTVTNVTENIVTISGSAPVDSSVAILVLNPGKTVSDVTTQHISAVQYMGLVYSVNGAFTCSFQMDTGVAPNKSEGAFTILVSINDALVYSDTNFVFYSNETKMGYLDNLKNCTAAQLLQIEEAPLTKVEKIFETFSLSNHELYKEVTPSLLADVIVAQNERKTISDPTDADAFLLKAVVLGAFSAGSRALADGEEMKYTDIWAKDGDAVSELYSNYFANDLDSVGKAAVINAVLSADYDGKEFSAPLSYFKDALLFNLIMNNVAIGSGHIDDYILGDFEEDYKALGFKTDKLAAITNSEKRAEKLDEIITCGATNIEALKTKFNAIVTATSSQSGNTSGGGGGGGAGGGGGMPSVNAPTSGGGTSEPTTTPAPTTTPQPTQAPGANYTFTDMNDTQWASEAVEYLYTKGIVNGRDEKTFAPSDTVTRAELVKMIVEAFEVADGAEDKAFSDVGENDWFAAYIKKAAAAGIVTGDGGAFRPNGGVTREDAAVIIFRALGLENSGEISFADAGDISDYAKDAISAMSAGGYINGMGDGTFAPKNTLTRAQAAQLIYNALVKGEAK